MSVLSSRPLSFNRSILYRLSQLSLGVLLSLGLWLWGGSLTAWAIAPSQQSPIDVHIHLGTETNELKFVPDRLQFTAGNRYKLILDNPSATKHYFTAKDFADTLWTQKVEAGQVEVKGAIHELELKPGAIAEWVFVPQKPGTYSLRCSIPGHTEAGMRGELVVE